MHNYTLYALKNDTLDNPVSYLMYHFEVFYFKLQMEAITYQRV